MNTLKNTLSREESLCSVECWAKCKSCEDVGAQVDCSELHRGGCRCRLSMHWSLPRHPQAPHASCCVSLPGLLIADFHGSSVTVGLACSLAVAGAFRPMVPLSHESAQMHRACPSRSICASVAPAMSLRSQCKQDRREFVLSFSALAASQVLPLSPFVAKAEDGVALDEQVYSNSLTCFVLSSHTVRSAHVAP
jgi:hypothetical protein